MTDYELGTTKDQDPHKLIRERAEAHVRRLEELVVAIGGEDATVESVLPTKYLEGPESVRRDAPLPEWTPDQIEAAQAVAHELGWGSEQDVESGLSGGVRILEGGLAWKIAAELEAAQRDGDPNSLILVGSKNRKITDDERAFFQERYGVALGADATEYDIAAFFAKRAADKDDSHEGTVEPFGYQVAPDNPTVYEATEQLISMGANQAGQEVLIIRSDREDYVDDETGKKKYRYQPRTVNLMNFVSDVLTAKGFVDDPVGFVTGSGYPSRIPDTIRAGLSKNRQYGLAMYGRANMAEVRQKPIQLAPNLEQLPGELGKTHKRYKTLLAELSQ
jgi:hypothetical protein